MTYTSEAVKQFVARAVLKSSRVWVPGHDGDSSALETVHAKFAAASIQPEQGVVEVEPHLATVLNIEVGPHTVWFVTAPSTQRVFFEEPSSMFGVAWGPDSATGKYVDLGFRTGDPIDAFLAWA